MSDVPVVLTEFEKGLLADVQAAMMQMCGQQVRSFTIELVVTQGDGVVKIRRGYRRRVRSEPGRYTSM